MKRLPLLLAIILALVVGAAAGHWLLPRPEVARNTSTACVKEADETPPKHCAPAKEETPLHDKPKPEDQPKPDAPPKAPKTTLAEALNAIEVGAPAKGNGQITGSVKTSDGAP